MMTLLIVAVALFVLLPLCAADGGLGGPPAAGAGGDDGGDAGHPDDAAAGDPDMGLLDDIPDGDEPQGAAPAPGGSGAAAPAGPVEGEPPATPATEEPATAQSVLARMGFGAEDLAGFTAEQQEKLSSMVSGWWESRYEPAAQRMLSEYQEVQQQAAQQEQYYRELDAFCQSPAFTLALQIAQTPGALERVQALLGQAATGGGPQGSNGNGALKLDELDPDTRRVYETHQTELQDLRGDLQQAMATVAEMRQRQEQAVEHARPAARAQGQELAGQVIADATAGLSKEYGFDLRAYPEAWRGAWRHVLNYVRGEGLEKGDYRQQIGALLRAGAKLSGADDIKRRRAQQMRTVARPPGTRSAQRGVPLSDQEIVEAGVAEAGLA
jgi:hypothetical protein